MKNDSSKCIQSILAQSGAGAPGHAPVWVESGYFYKIVAIAAVVCDFYFVIIKSFFFPYLFVAATHFEIVIFEMLSNFKRV